MKPRHVLSFLGTAALSATLLTAANAHAAWIHASATTCEVHTNGSITTPGSPPGGGAASGVKVGTIEGASGGNAMKLICPVVDTSALNVGNSTNFDNVAPVIYTPQVTQGRAQVCTNFVATTGGACSAEVLSSNTSGMKNWAVSTTNWTTYPNDYHFIWVSIPVQVSGEASAFYGYSVYHS